MIDIKNTLNMPKTDFEMKANLNIKEPLIQNNWVKNKIYYKRLKLNSSNKHWILHDGPPYANGDIHVGHSLNKILKDIIVRYKNAIGLYSPFIMGWDTHGLPIEQALSKKDPKQYNLLSTIEKRNKCFEFANKNIVNQKNQFCKLGIFTDYNNFYATNTKDFESRQLDLFKKMLEKKLIYQALKPVYWSWSSQTALADAEIEYKDVESDSIYISFNISKGNDFIKTSDKLIIWTTTPWTIPSNLAVAVHPTIKYARVLVGKENFILGYNLIEKIAKILSWKEYKIISTFDGSDIENLTYFHPLYNNINPIILATYVSDTDGTGLVHNAPGFGDDDYLACKKYNINPFCPIDKWAKFTKELNDNELNGVFYENANQIIINRLKNTNNLLHSSKFIHSIACDWRTKKPVIYRATKQWFVNIKNIQNDIIENLKSVKFNNLSNKKHMEEMIKNRNEWCISRQRVWGVPITMIYANDEPIFDMELINNIISIVQNEGCNVWFDKPVEYFLTKKYIENKTVIYTKETDIMDVWFDSGSSHLLLQANNLNSPCQLYLEGNDQYRGWFNSSLITSTIYNNFCPYEQLISHGFTTDEKGRKMSKSLGNGIDPMKVISQYGADVLRIWISNADYTNDISISENILKQNAEIYRRIRNSLFKFCLSNIYDFELNKNYFNNFSEYDCLVLQQLEENIQKINKWYENFEFLNIVRCINSHIIDLSSWYFDLIKDSLYCDELNNPKRRSIQTVLYFLLNTYTILLQPIIPHTCEEVYSFFTKQDKKESIILENWVTSLNLKINNIDTNKWKQIFEIKQIVFAQLEKLREQKIINKNNESDITIILQNKYNITNDLLKIVLNVATVNIKNCESKDIQVECVKTKKIRCERCWNYFDSIEIENQFCDRCNKVIK